MGRFIDLTGQPFERLTVLRRGQNRKTSARWICECSCGTICTVDSADLRRKKAKSCGCIQREIAQALGKTRATHGLADSPEYRMWNGIKKRCLTPTAQNYSYYGGRGITICDAWKESFQKFYDDMGPRPTPQHTIERRSNDLGYDKENCYWATVIEQAHNRRNNHMITIENATRCLVEWLEIYHIGRSTFSYRVNHGWSLARALTTPVRVHGLLPLSA